MVTPIKYGQHFIKSYRGVLKYKNFVRNNSKLDAQLKGIKVQNKSLNTPLNSVVYHETLKEVNIQNDNLHEYNRGSRDLFRLESVLNAMKNNTEDIPIMINGKKQPSRVGVFQIMPHKINQKLARFYYCTDKQLFTAIDSAKSAQKQWDRVAISQRIEIWEKAAELLGNKYRAELVASTMLGQGQVLNEAEKDAGVDLIDILRINASFLKLLTQWQPTSQNKGKERNHFLIRGMQGFVAALCSFHSTALAANLALTPLLMGNCVLWKPHNNNVLPCWIIYKAMIEAGLPENVISFVPTDGQLFAQTVTHSEHLTGLNYSGSGPDFKKIWKLVAKYLEYYHNYPRMVGECGGKNFHFVHPSADPSLVIDCTIRSAFEYSGQKRTSCSRFYVPESLWNSHIKDDFIEKTKALKVGDVCDFDNFTSAVIDIEAFSRLTTLIETAQRNPKFRLLAGGKCNSSKGFYIDPTILQCTDMYDRIYRDDYCGPVLVVYVYKDKEINRVLDNLATVNPYALSASIFSRDENFLKSTVDHFKYSIGNLFLNDKSTAITIGQQPLGGTRMSGTNSKIGSPYYLLSWTSLQTIKESLVPNST